MRYHFSKKSRMISTVDKPQNHKTVLKIVFQVFEVDQLFYSISVLDESISLSKHNNSIVKSSRPL